MYVARGYADIPRYNADPYAERRIASRQTRGSRRGAGDARARTRATGRNASRASVVSANSSASSAGPAIAAA